MSNEELVVLIQGGERDRLPQLWAQVERFVAQQASRRLVRSNGFGGVEFGDLYNAGYLALIEAVDSFDPGAGKAFTSWLFLHLKTAFARAGGYQSRKQARDPLHRAGSLDVPAGEYEGGATLGELVPDQTAVQPFEDVEDKLYREQLRSALGSALAVLPENERRTIQQQYYYGRGIRRIAAIEGVSKSTVQNWHSRGFARLRDPQVSRALRAYL